MFAITIVITMWIRKSDRMFRFEKGNGTAVAFPFLNEKYIFLIHKNVVLIPIH